MTSKDRVAYIDFFYREYRIRHIYCSDNREILCQHIANLSNFIFEYAKVDFLHKRHMDCMLYHHAKKKHLLIGQDNLCDCFTDSYEFLTSHPSAFDSLKYIYDASYEHGLYMTDITEFPEKIIGIADFGMDYINSRTRRAFCQQRFRPEHIGDSICSLSPKEMCEVFECNYENGDFLLNRYAFLVDIDRKEFDLKTVLEEVKRDLILYTINCKILARRKISDDEWKLFEQYNPALSGTRFRSDSIKSRYIGLAMWDLENLHDYSSKEAFDILCEEGQLVGFRSTCKKKDGASRLENGTTPCRCCSYIDDCFKQVCDLRRHTQNSIKCGKIMPIG